MTVMQQHVDKYQRLDRFIAALQECGWCGRLNDAETCYHATGSHCPPAIDWLEEEQRKEQEEERQRQWEREQWIKEQERIQQWHDMRRERERR